MTTVQKLRLRKAEAARRLAELAGLDELDDAARDELRTLPKDLADIEAQLAAAELADEAAEETRASKPEDGDEGKGDGLDELRSAAHVGRYLVSAMRGRPVQGAERELLDELKLEDGVIPLTLWDRPETRAADERRDVSPAPGTVGVNLDPLQPAIFAPSILPRLGVEMPRVGTGTYATGTLTTSLTSGAQAKGAAATATAAAFTVSTATPKRISARLELAAEDIAAVGQANFESVLRENLSLVLSDELDKQGLNGDGTAPNLQGLLGRLTAPTDPTDVATWDTFARLPSDHIDGLWAAEENQVMLLAGVDSYKLAARTWREPRTIKEGNPSTGFSAATPGSRSSARYLMDVAGGFASHIRMPDAASDIQLGLVYRMGRGGIRTAVCPHWDYLSIDDIYTGSAKAERYFTLHVLLGDVIVVQPGAYALFKLKTA